jgi:hypothetical protein
MHDDDTLRREGRGDSLLLAHLASFDPARMTARERLEREIGPELAHKLVFALSTGPHLRAA